jgi:hypothetical protein
MEHDNDDDSNILVFTPAYEIISKTLILMSHYTKKEFTSVVWVALTKAVPTNGLESHSQQIRLARALSVVNVLVLARKGTRVYGTTKNNIPLFFFFPRYS